MRWLDLLEGHPLPPRRFDTSGEDILLLLKPELKKLMARFKGPVTDDLVQQCREFGLFGLLNGSGEGQLALAPLVYARLMRFISFHHPELASLVAHANLTGSYANDSAETAGTPPIHDTASMAAGIEDQPGLAVMERISTMAIILGQLDLAVTLMAEFISIRVIFNRKMVEFELIRTRRDHIKEDILRLEALLFWTCQDDTAAAPLEAHVAYAAFSSQALATIGEIVHLFGGTGLMADSGIPGVYTSILETLKAAAPCPVGCEHLVETMGKTPAEPGGQGRPHRDMNQEP